MIRNIFIIKDGIPLMKLNFGECHSLQVEDDLLTGFISGLVSFSREATGSSIKKMTFDDYVFHFLKQISGSHLLYVLVSEEGDEMEEIEFKMNKIADLFHERYSSVMEDFCGEVSRFEEFKQLLLDMNLAQKNCGGRPECDGCPNSSNVAHFLESFQKKKKGFFQRVKDFFLRT